MEFNKQPVVTQPVVQTPPPQEPKGFFSSALEFFGQSFAAKPKPVAKPTPPISDGKSVLSGGWDAINAKSRAEQPARDAQRLDLLQQELAANKDPKVAEMLKREIAREDKKRNKK